MTIDIATRIKAQVLKGVIDNLAGGDCILEDRESSVKIILSDTQKKWFQDFLDKQFDLKRKPDIEIDAIGIILPVIMKRVWPFVAAGGAGIAALVLGKKKSNYVD
jgi:hypothetical protein